MPSIASVVADLRNGSIIGVGTMPEMNYTRHEKTISDICRVKYNSVHMNASISPTNRLECVGAATSLSFNGNYLFFQDDWSTVANMDINRRLVVSGKFSGCMWKVFRSDQAGLFKCVHIARPAGAAANTLVTLISGAYAPQNQWVEIQSISSVGHIGVNGCVEMFVVSQLFPNDRIDTALLDINNQGLVVATTFRSDNV